MTFPAITPLPTAPQRTQTPDQFATTADAFVAALPDLVTEVNAAGAYIDTKSISVGNTFKGNYSAGTTYAQGESVLYSDGKFYLSLVNSNTGNTPPSSPSQWVEILGAVSASQTGTSEFVATGSIPNGSLVGLNADGTVSVITAFGLTSKTVFESANTTNISSTFDSTNNRIVIAYRDVGNSDFGTAVVGTVSGNTISFGTPVVFESASTSNTSATFDSTNNRVVIAYTDGGNSSFGTAIVGTVSGTSISFGTPVVFESAATSAISTTYDSTNNRVVIAYQDNGNSNFGTAIVGTVSGTSISFGTAVVFDSTNFGGTTRAVFDTANSKVVITYGPISNVLYAIVGTVSGTSISFGTRVTLSASSLGSHTLVYDSTNSKVVAITEHQSLDFGRAHVGTVSGTSISFGTEVRFISDLNIAGAVYDPVPNKVVFFFTRTVKGAALLHTIMGTVSGTSISFGTESISDITPNVQTFAYDSTADKIVVAYADLNNSSFGTASVLDANTTIPRFIGISEETINNGATGPVTILSGINESLTGLSVGSRYYIQNDATLTTTVVPNREVGRALSATKLLITQGSADL